MRHFILTALLACAFALPARADDAPPPAPGKALCQSDPQKCEEMRARRHEFCKEHPAKCRQVQRRREERREWCEEHREQCAKRKADIHERSDARQAEFCKQHPEQCPNRHDDEEQFHPHAYDMDKGPQNERPSGPPR